MTVIPVNDPHRPQMADDVQSLAHFVRSYGGNVLEGTRTFQFEIELAHSRKAVSEINRIGLRCEKVGERQGNDRNGKACSIATIQVNRPPARTEYQDARNLMMVATGTK
jgi:hypothetical protein